MSRDDVTQLLTALESGDPRAGDELVALLYGELRAMAHGLMAGEQAGGAGHTLQPTALVHDAWLRLGGGNECWNSRAHFMGAAAQAMRRVLIERARRRDALKRGGDREKVELRDDDAATPGADVDLIALDEALDRLEAHDPRKAQVVQLRYFGGLGVDAVAQILGVSKTTVKDDWAYARLWLFRELDG